MLQKKSPIMCEYIHTLKHEK